MADGTSGVVLAGGAGRRMSGLDKRAVLVDGRPLLTAAVTAAAAVCDEVLVAASDARPPASVPGARPVFDRRADAGPLAGVEAGLVEAGHPLVLVLAGDHPRAVPAVLAALLSRLAAADDLQAVVLGTDDGPQPLVGAYRRAGHPVVTRLLDRGERRARALLDELATGVLHAADWHALDPERATAVDLDTPADLAAWRARR